MPAHEFGWGAGPWGRGTWGQLDVEIVIPTRPTLDVFLRGGGGGQEAGGDFYYDDEPRIEKPSPLILVPDAITGPGKWKPHAIDAEPVAEKIRPIVYNFASDIPPDSRHRVLVFLKEAEKRKLVLDQSDAFLLKMKLNIFTKDEEKAMQGGTMLRLIPTKADFRLSLARLGIDLNFRLVTFDRRQLFMFDNETIHAKVHPIAWLSLGVGYGLWLGWEWRGRKSK
jgi:hypothetical protein